MGAYSPCHVPNYLVLIYSAHTDLRRNLDAIIFLLNFCDRTDEFTKAVEECTQMLNKEIAIREAEDLDISSTVLETQKLLQEMVIMITLLDIVTPVVDVFIFDSITFLRQTLMFFLDCRF
jgi:hypothetical protein